MNQGLVAGARRLRGCGIGAGWCIRRVAANFDETTDPLRDSHAITLLVTNGGIDSRHGTDIETARLAVSDRGRTYHAPDLTRSYSDKAGC